MPTQNTPAPADTQLFDIALHTPLHSQLPSVLSYSSALVLSAGQLVRVPLGKQEVLGVVWGQQRGDKPHLSNSSTKAVDNSNKLAQPPSSPPPLAPDSLPQPLEALFATPSPKSWTARPVGQSLPLPPLSAHWRALVSFAASYYHRSVGEVALLALPTQLRHVSAEQLLKRLEKATQAKKPKTLASCTPSERALAKPPALNEEQSQALAAFQATPAGSTSLLWGVTGSGKTEVYLQAVAQMLAADPQAQALVLVPEINLTPQLEAQFVGRFASEWGSRAVVMLHSRLTPAKRLQNWLLAHTGQARVVVGTRVAVFASLPHLRLLVVDEEHDPSYKQQEGARYNARDLAIYRGKQEDVRVLLGSATPSLETWWACEQGRYTRLVLKNRATGSPLPQVEVVDMQQHRASDAPALPLQGKTAVLAPPVTGALQACVARGEQALVFLNRRGYAPVLVCDCGWKSQCPHCSVYRVFHKPDRSLRCHHCGLSQPVPRSCPSCGNLDIQPGGRGTQRLEEELHSLLSELRRPNGEAIRIARIDSDTTTHQGSLEAQLEAVHAGDVDVLVGTQMLTKGHDFQRITQVVALQVDAALFSGDFRASERLFTQLMQAAGRCGRSGQQVHPGQMWLQTQYPDHPLFKALQQHDYVRFAQHLLKERKQAQMPPFAYQAVLYAYAQTQEVAQGFLNAAKAQAPHCPNAAQVALYDAVPLPVQKVAGVERAQLLVEGQNRRALQGFLGQWQGKLQGLRVKGLLRWLMDVDPLGV